MHARELRKGSAGRLESGIAMSQRLPTSDQLLVTKTTI